jgi:uncharacterized protein
MKWTRGDISRNIEDRRGQPASRGGFPIPLRLGRGRFGVAGTIIVLVVVLARNYLFSGGDTPRPSSAEEQELVSFVSFVLDDLQAVWRQELAARGRTYRDAKLVLFTDSVRSGCGYAEAQIGPFYCSADEKAYIDLSFYAELRRRFGAPGDFAQAYVLAHEIGHHLQHLFGTSDEVHRKQRVRPGDAKPLSVRLELQADCYAGIWAHSTAKRGLLDVGDAEEAIKAAEAIGDDRLQRQATGRVNPESFTHGSSAQRMKWFRVGYDSGRLESCDTFSIAAP